MRFLYAAVAAFLIPCLASTAFLLALGAPVEALIEDLTGQVLIGLMAAAPFLMMAVARRGSPGARFAIRAGLALTVLPYIVMIVDLLLAEPGRGANIGLGLLFLVWPLIVFLAMLGLSFIQPRVA